MLHSQQEDDSVLFEVHRGHAEMMSEAIKVTQRWSVPEEIESKKRGHVMSCPLVFCYQIQGAGIASPPPGPASVVSAPPPVAIAG